VNIKKVNIENFKSYKGKFSIELNSGINILVGDNEAGKSTILEAIHLALTGILNGKYLKNELTQYLFNNDVIQEYVISLKGEYPLKLPSIIIELFLDGEEFVIFEGDKNSQKKSNRGFTLEIAFDEKYKSEYEQLINIGNIKTIPIEYYEINWTSFARESITTRSIPLKSALIDSSNNRFQNGSDVYISRIIKDFLEPKEIVDISQAHRKMKESFIDDKSIININSRLKDAINISQKEVTLSVDLSSKNAWENSLITYLDNVPFHYIGKGEQCIVKTKLALGHKKAKEANLILLEEPENHLSHTKLNELVYDIKTKSGEKQILISTHSSFVANKLGLNHLILLNNKKTLKLDDLSDDSKRFFEKLSGYNTLRLLLCKKAILVEGDSDELIVQKAYMIKNNGKLPIQNGIDVISVGTSFLRFLEIAEKINKRVIVVTDNDGDVEALKVKYENYLGKNKKENIKICYDEMIDEGDYKIGKKPFNYNTLEPKILKVNGKDKLNLIFGKKYENVDDLHKYMKTNKTECAIKIFDTEEEIIIPQYILESIS
jgi:putative ATP-dependent endonuclease of OLD family